MKKQSLFSLMMILFCLSCIGMYARHRKYKVDDTLYHYLIQTRNNLAKPLVGLSMLDTLYSKARQKDDLEVQCMALYGRVDYYLAQKQYEEQRKEFERIAPLILKTPYKQYYFASWNLIIIGDLNSGRQRVALTELSKYQDQAVKLKNDYAMMHSFLLLADYYMYNGHVLLAYSQAKKALEYGKKYGVEDLSTVYARIGQICLLLRRWNDSEKALQTSLLYPSDIRDNSVSDMLLLSLYCRMDTMDNAKVEAAYQKVQSICANKSLSANNQLFYNVCMRDYYRYYKKNEKVADEYANLEMAYNDSLTYYMTKARECEEGNDFKSSSQYYRKYGDLISRHRLDNEKFLMSSFVPQPEYQKIDQDRIAQQQRKVKIKLQEAVDDGLLLRLSDERDRAMILRRLKDESILKNKYATQRLSWRKQQQELVNERLKAEQRRKDVQLIKEKDFWRRQAFHLVLAVLILLLGLYMYQQYKLRKRLKKEKDKAEKSERIKSLFFQNMNHEIRSPLNAIIGFNDVLNSEDAIGMTVQQKSDYIDMIETNSNLLLKLVADVLDLSNFEGGTYQLTPANVDIKHLCHTVLESVRGRQAENVTLCLQGIPDKSYILHTDAQRLQQVLTNYLTNACKYTEEGSITLSYEVLPDIVRFAVTDTGCGVKAEDSDKIFERFHMLDKSKRGIGLGLHICRIIADLFHGRAYVDTSYSKGARFVFDHPLKCLFSLFIALCFSFLPAQAQNNPLKIHDNLYQYYLKMEKVLNLSVGDAMCDTLFEMARREGDVKAQCIALSNKTKHYRYTKQEDLLLKNFDLCRRFCTKNKYPKYIFKTWGYVINYYIYQKRFKEALLQLRKYQELMRLEGDSYSISMYYYEVGNFYTVQQQNATALSYYLLALKYKTSEQLSIYTQIGYCYFILGNYLEAIRYTKKALSLCQSDVMRINPSMTLAKSYCLMGDEENAKKMISIVKRYQNENMTHVSFSNFYMMLYYYYSYIKKDKEKALEAALAAGTKDTPEWFGEYYYSDGKYKMSNRYYKEYARLSTEWLNTDLGALFDAYISKFDYDKIISKRDKLTMDNIRLRLEAAEKRRQVLLLQREKSVWQLRKANYVTRQRESEVALQNMSLAQQKIELEKQHIINAGIERQRDLDEQRLRWFTCVFFLVILLVVIFGIVIVYKLRKRAKRLRQETITAEATERAKNRFYQRVGDKIKVPLQNIVALNRQLNTYNRTELTALERSDILRRLSRSSKYLNTVVSNVLDISKIESGTYKIHPVQLEVNGFCRTIMNDADVTVSRDVTLLFKPDSVDSSKPLYIKTDESRLRFILSVYISNSCRHTTSGSITLAYEILPGIIRFSVTDTGRMLSSEEAAMIFSRYLSDNRNGNLGLNLYLVSLSAKLIGGKAYADSTGLVNGARFYLEIPIK